MVILKQPRPKNTATKSKKYNKNPTNNIFGGVKRPRDDKKWALKNQLTTNKKKIYGLISGFDIAFNDETEFKKWLLSFKDAIMRPTNTRHNTNYQDHIKYKDKYVCRFDMRVRDTINNY